MSRDPMIWWNLLTAFLFMLALVLSANLFADAVRDAFDPRSRRYKPARLPTLPADLPASSEHLSNNTSASPGERS